jgi:DHA1 family multidrug resistance protein-like MFS transporter
MWVAVFVALMGMSLVIPFLPLYLTELGVPDSQTRLWAGWVGGVNFLCAAFLAPLWGALADRFGRKPMALRALVGLAVTVGLMAYVQNVYQLFGLRVLQGAFGGFVAEAIALVGASVPRERVGRSLGVLQTAVVGGNLIGPVFGGELSHHFGYRATFQVTGVALLIAMLLIFWLVREQPRSPEDRPHGLAKNVRELLRLPALRWMMVVVICGHSALMLINPQISLFVRDLVGPSGQVDRIAGWVTAAPALAGFLMAPLWGRWGDERGHARVLSGALLGAAVLVPWAGWAAAWWHLLLVRFAMGGFTAALNPSAHSVAAHSVEEGRTAGAFSLLSSAQMLGACVGPFLSGPIATLIGVRPLFPITGVLLCCGAFAAYRVALLRSPGDLG